MNCNPINMNGEAFAGHPFSFSDAGGNRCGCDDETSECKVLSTQLLPPEATEF